MWLISDDILCFNFIALPIAPKKRVYYRATRRLTFPSLDEICQYFRGVPTAHLDEILNLFEAEDLRTPATLAGAFYSVFKQHFPQRVLSIRRFQDKLTLVEVKEAIHKFSGFNVSVMVDEGILNIWHFVFSFFNNSLVLYPQLSQRVLQLLPMICKGSVMRSASCQNRKSKRWWSSWGNLRLELVRQEPLEPTSVCLKRPLSIELWISSQRTRSPAMLYLKLCNPLIKS